MAAPIRVGIVGYGFSAKCFHLPFILPNPALEVYAILQRAAPPSNPSEASALKWGHCTVDLPAAKHYRTPDDFYADDAIELVVVCTHTHGEFVERALLAGKHGEELPELPIAGPWVLRWHLHLSVTVVVEKHFVDTSAEADRLITLAKEKGKILTVFQSKTES